MFTVSEQLLEQIYRWPDAEVGDSSQPYVYEATAEKIIEYCRAARYENLAYTSQPAARGRELPDEHLIADYSLTCRWPPDPQ